MRYTITFHPDAKREPLTLHLGTPPFVTDNGDLGLTTLELTHPRAENLEGRRRFYARGYWVSCEPDTGG